MIDRQGNVDTMSADRAFVGKQGELKFVNNDGTDYGETVGVYSGNNWNKFFAKGKEAKPDEAVDRDEPGVQA